MNHHSSKASLFLMELIITILIFSAASAVCVQLFAKSHLISIKTLVLNNAVIQTESAAEVFLSTEGNLPHMEKILDTSLSGALSDSSLTLYYDKDFIPSGKADASYELCIQKEVEEVFIHGSISYFDLSSDSGNSVYQLKVTKYTGGDFHE